VSDLQSIEGVVVVILLAGCALWWLVHRLSRSRPGLRIGAPIAVGFGLRLAAIVAIGATGLESTLRGGDELTFRELAQHLAAQPIGHGYLPHGPYQLHTVLFALQLKLGFLTVGALRVTQVAIAMLGLVLIMAAIYDLADGRAARLGAWILAFEPASVFFNSELHKEPNMELAAGLVVFGGTMIWKRLDVRGILLCAVGGLIAVETRSYAGWFLVSAAVFVLLHAALRSLDRPLRAMPAIYAVVLAAFLTTPTLITATSTKKLQALQQSQNANTTGAGQATGGPNGDNLRLERIDFSTRGKVLANLPKRIRDVGLRPYPWQLNDASQRFGAIGTVVAYIILLLLLVYGWQSRGHIFARAGPVLYPLFFLLVAYSLASGNAGTAYRYRTHLVTLGIAAVVILREQVMLARAKTRARFSERPEESSSLRAPVASPV
jgi:hypothetical protein